MGSRNPMIPCLTFGTVRTLCHSLGAINDLGLLRASLIVRFRGQSGHCSAVAEPYLRNLLHNLGGVSRRVARTSFCPHRTGTPSSRESSLTRRDAALDERSLELQAWPHGTRLHG